MSRSEPRPHRPGPEWRQAEALGLDMTLVKEQLRLSVTERIARNDEAAAFLRAVQEAGRKIHESNAGAAEGVDRDASPSARPGYPR